MPKVQKTFSVKEKKVSCMGEEMFTSVHYIRFRKEAFHILQLKTLTTRPRENTLNTAAREKHQ